MEKFYTEFKAFFRSRLKKQFMSLLMATVILFLSVTGAAETSIAAYRDNYINSIFERYEDGELSRDEARRELIRHGVKDSPIFDFDEDSDGNKISTQSDIPAKLGEAERRLDEKILSAIDKISSSKSAFVYARHRDTIENAEAVIEDLATKSEVQKDSKSSDSKAAETKKATASEIEQGVFYLEEETDESKADSGSKSEETNSVEKETIGTDGDSEAEAIDISDYLTISSVKRLSNGDLIEASEFDSNKKINVTLFFSIPGEDLSEEDRSVVYMIPEGLIAAKEESGNVRSDGRSIGRYVLKEDSLTISFDKSFVKKGKDIDGAFYFKAKTMVDSDDDMVEVELGGLAGSISVYKAQTMTSISDDGKVSVTASYGISAFKENVSLKVSALETEDMKNAEEAFNELLEDENLFARNIYTYDISFVDDEGNEVEPDGNVSISMEFTEPVETEENSAVKVFHIENNDLNNIKDLTDSEETVVSQDEDGQVQKVEFSSETFSPYSIVVTVGDMKDLLTDVSIEGARSDDGNIWVVSSGETYTLKLEFEENNSFQFPDDNAWMYYQIPKGLYLEDKKDTFRGIIDGQFVIDGNTIKVDSKKGTVAFQWNTESDNFSKLQSSTNKKIYAELTGSFDKSSEKVLFSTDVIREIIIDDSNTVDVVKSSSYDYNNKKIHFTVTATSKGISNNVEIVDTIEGKAINLDEDSIKISGVSNEAIKETSAKGFIVYIPKMKNGEQATITYTASVDFQKIENSGQVAYEETGNSVTAKINGKPVDTDKWHESYISFSSLKKSGSLDGSSKENISNSEKGYSKNVLWTIEANNERLTHVSYIKDTIDKDSQKNMEYSGDGIDVELTDVNGNIKTLSIPWANLTWNGKYSWTWNTPKYDVNDPYYKASYKVTYKTSVQMQDRYSDLDVINHAETDHHGSVSEKINIASPKDNSVKASKHASAVTAEEVLWTININVPATGIDELIVVDTLPNTWIDKAYYDEFEKIEEVTGLMGKEYYELTSTTGSFTLTFYKDNDKAKDKTNEGLNATSSERTINIIYKTKNNKYWLDYAKTSEAWRMEHKNEAKVNGYSVYASAFPSTEALKKSGKYIYTNYPGKIIYQYDLTLSGVTHDGITIDDQFDTNVLSFFDFKVEDGYFGTEALIYGGNYRDAVWDITNEHGEKAETTKYDEQGKKVRGGGLYAFPETDTGGIKFYIKNFPRQKDGSFYGFYRICYYLAIDESDAIRLALENNGKAQLKNIAFWDSEKSEAIVTYEHNPLKKEYKYDSTKGIASYTITINSGKETLNKGNVMILEDVFENQIIDISTINITAEDKSGKDRHNEISYSLEDNVLSFQNIPDEAKVVITYDALPIFTSNTVTLKNKANLMGYEDETNFEAYFTALAKANGSTAKLKLVKYKEGDIQTLLPGAVFELYYIDKESDERKPVNDSNGHIIKFTTGSDGTVEVSLDYQKTGQKMYFNQKYCLVESKAPDGYVVNEENVYYFTLGDNTKSDTIYSYDSANPVYPNGYVLTVSNRSFLTMLLPSTGGMGTNMIYLAGFIMILLGSTFILFKKYKKG